MKTNKLQRIESVDLIRGLAILVMILLHTNAYFLKNPISFFTWDWGQFAVPLFIFCSSYVFFKKNYQFANTLGLFKFIKKRILRLLVPYYLFVAFFLILLLTKEPQKLSLKYLLSSLTINGGIDINWLVLLFVYFSIIMPFTQWAYQKKRALFYSFLSFSFFSSVVFMFYRPDFNYRLIMWLPWSLLIIISLYIYKFENNNKLMLLGFAGSLILFITSRLIQINLNHSLVMYDNKYPPNFYHLSFCSGSIFLIYWVAKIGVFSFYPINKYLSFLSKNSYSLYFIHYCMIYVLSVFTKIKFDWINFFVATTITTTVFQWLLNSLIIFFRNYTGVRQSEYWRAPSS